jgi:hypothetical protein
MQVSDQIYFEQPGLMMIPSRPTDFIPGLCVTTHRFPKGARLHVYMNISPKPLTIFVPEAPTSSMNP